MALLDYSPYEAARRNLLNQFAQQSALNAYQRFLAQRAGERTLGRLEETAFGRTASGQLGQVPKLTSSYARRGLQTQGARSGIYKQAMENYARQRERLLGETKEDLASRLRGYDLSQTGYQAGLETGLTDIEARKAQQIAQDAQQLLNLR